MKIAALIEAHHRPANLARLVRRLGADLWRPIVHIDAKSDLSPFEAAAPAAEYLAARRPANWGSLGSVEVGLALLRAAVRDPDFTHFYLMSGQCYPLKSDAEIRAAVSSAEPGRQNFITRLEMPAPSKPIERLTRWHPYDFRPGAVQAIARRVLSRLPPRSLDRFRGFAPHGGSAWWLLERPAAERMLRVVDENPWLMAAFRHTFIPDEAFFQTVSVAAGVETAGPSPTMTLWRDGSPHPELVTRTNYAELAADWRFFGRKFIDYYPDDGFG